MALDKKSGRKRKEDSEDLSKLTRQQLRDLEAREKTTGRKYWTRLLWFFQLSVE